MNNLVILMGRLTKELELKKNVSTNNIYCNNSLAVDMGKDKNGNKRSIFVNFTLWENNAEYLYKYAKKGGRVILTGYLDQTKQFNYEKNFNEYELIFKVKEIEIIDWKERELKSNLTGELPNQNVNESVINHEDPFESFAEQMEISDEDLPF